MKCGEDMRQGEANACWLGFWVRSSHMAMMVFFSKKSFCVYFPSLCMFRKF